MSKIKEFLIKKEYKDMINNTNPNLREYLLTIESEFIAEAYEQDNYYLLKYCLLDLRSLEPVIISEKILNNNLNNEIPKNLAIILHETNIYVSTSNRFSYDSLINNGWIKEQYLFEAIPLKESITSLNDLVILPSTEKAIIHYLNNISYNLSDMSGQLYEMRADTSENLNNIDKALDLIGYVIQK